MALIAPQGLVTPAGVIPRLKQFTVVGVFEAGITDADSALALVHLQDAQTLYQMGDAVSGVRLKLDDLFAARTVARELLVSLPRDVFASDWTRSHANFFRAVEIEKRMMFMILTLIILGRGDQHHLDAGGRGHRQAGRHRHPAHARRRAGLDHADLHRAGDGDRRHRHAGRDG